MGFLWHFYSIPVGLLWVSYIYSVGDLPERSLDFFSLGPGARGPQQAYFVIHLRAWKKIKVQAQAEYV